MKKVFGILALLAIAACNQDKIGYVDNVKMMEAYQEKIDVEAKYQAKLDKIRKKGDSLSQAFQLELQMLQTKVQNMSQKKAQEEYQLLQQRGQSVGQQLQQEEQAAQMEGQAAMDSLIKKVKGEISEYGKANGYTYILGGGEGGSVLYGDETKNLTDAVVKVLNNKYKQ